jgi:formate dehydrogenase major subunit
MAEPTNVLTLDGNKVSFQAGQTVLQVARDHGAPIPSLCHLDGCAATGACRVCVVEIKGARSLVASCTIPAAPGMEVWTRTEKVIQSRRLNIELLLSMGRHDCVTCEANGDCVLQSLAYEYRVETVRFARPESHYPTEAANPMIIRDFSRCVLCGRCVQACNEVQVNEAISHGFRGARSKIVTKGDQPYEQSDCVFCGECLQACPVGALVEKQAKGRGRPWEMQKVKTTCAYCGVGCQMFLHVRNGRVVKVTGDAQSEPNHGSLCVKGRFGYDFIHSPERLTKPLIRENGDFREAGWDEALDLVTRRFREIRQAHGPDSLAGLTSARATNEENYLMQKLVRAGFGANHIDHCARL